MVKKDIYSSGIASVIFNSFLAIFLSFGSYIIYSINHNDSYIIAIFGSVISLFLTYILINIFKSNNKDTVFEYAVELYGKKIGSILNILIILSLVFVLCSVIYSISNFLNIEYLNESKLLYLELLIAVPLVYIATKELPTLVKTNQIFFFITIAILLLDLIGVIGKIELTNLEPFFINIKLDFNLLKSIIFYTSFCTIPLFFMIIANKSMIEDKKNITKKIYGVSIFSSVVIIINFLVTILILGKEYISSFRFPEYIALKQFTLFNIVERIENILALTYLFGSFCLISNILFMIMSIINYKNYEKREKIKGFLASSILGISILISNSIFKEANMFIEVIQNYIFYVIFIGMVIPVLLIFIKCKFFAKKD